jgi:uncharacterized LabA/DUF88 family protein
MYTFEHLIDAQMEVRKMLIQSGVDMDVANDMFLRNVTEGCKQISIFNLTQHNNDSSSEEAGSSS